MKFKNILSTLVLLMTSFTWSCQKEAHIKKILCGNQGYFWDVIYIEGKYRKSPWQGYYFRNDGKYYAYLYGDEGRRPVLIAPHRETPSTIEANLRNWSIEDDSVLDMEGAGIYLIAGIREDSLFLVLKSEYRPLIKLAKAQE